MSNFNAILAELKQDIIDEHDRVDGSEIIDEVVDRVFACYENELGENALRQLEIGILQDELVKLGFESGIKTISTWNKDNDDKRLFLSIYFDKDSIEAVNFNGEVLARFEYTSPTWQQDVLDKVKELIDEK